MNKSIFSLLLFFVVFLVSSVLMAQSPGYLNYTVEDGLPSNLGYSTLQDQEGYIWFGTDKGLSRFDGERFKNFGVKDGLPDPEVLTMYEDQHKRLWLGCFRQKPTFRFKGQFYTGKLDALFKNIAPPFIGYDFVDGAEKDLWMVSGSLINIKGLTPPQMKLSFNNTKLSIVKKVNEDWLGFHVKKIYRLDLKSQPVQFDSIFHFTQKSFTEVAVNGNYLLIGFLDSTLLMKYVDEKLIILKNYQESFDYLYTDREGYFWGIAPGKGAYRFGLEDGRLTKPTIFFRGKKVSSVYQDQQGNFWFHSIGEGVYFLPQKYSMIWRQSDGLLSDHLMSLTEDQQGHLLIGDDIGNVYQLNEGRLTLRTAFDAYDGSNWVRQMLPGPKGYYAVTDENLYFAQGTQFQAVTQLNIGAYKSMVLDNEDGIWVGSSSGLFYQVNHQQAFERITSRRTTVLAKDHQGYIWQGCTDGLFSEVDDFAKNWGENFPEFASRIIAIQPGRGQHLWILNAQNKILQARVEGGRIIDLKPFFEKQSFGNIRTLKVAGPNSLWLATNQGVYLLKSNGAFRRFTTRHGLSSNEVNDVLIQQDTLWAATAKGLSRILAGDLSNQREILKTRMVGFEYQADGEMVNLDFSGKHHLPVQLTLPASSHLVKAAFATPLSHPFLPSRLRQIVEKKVLPFPHFTFSNFFEVLTNKTDTLEQLSSRWNFGINVPPGKYHFQTASQTFDEFGFNQALEWEMTVLPSFAQTIWPWLAFVLLSLLLLARYIQITTANLKLETSSAQAKLMSLRSQINPHFIGNSINAIQQFFYPPDPEKASDYIHLFTVLLRKTLEMSEKDFVTIEEEVEYLEEYLEMIQLRYFDRFVYDILVDDNIKETVLFPTMFLQPILENSTIHGMAKLGISKLKVHFFLEKDRLCCRVVDNGMGIDESLKRKKRERKVKRSSKGIVLLEQKKDMLNHLHSIDLQMKWTDLSQNSTKKEHGTEVLLSYLYQSYKPIQS